MVGMLFWLVIAIVLAEFGWSVALTLLNIKASRQPIPDLLRDLYDERVILYEKYADTTIEEKGDVEDVVVRILKVIEEG